VIRVHDHLMHDPGTSEYELWYDDETALTLPATPVFPLLNADIHRDRVPVICGSPDWAARVRKSTTKQWHISGPGCGVSELGRRR
jgi:hypothetical protein